MYMRINYSRYDFLWQHASFSAGKQLLCVMCCQSGSQQSSALPFDTMLTTLGWQLEATARMLRQFCLQLQIVTLFTSLLAQVVSNYCCRSLSCKNNRKIKGYYSKSAGKNVIDLQFLNVFLRSDKIIRKELPSCFNK